MQKKGIDKTLARILRENGLDFEVRDTPKDFLEYIDGGKTQMLDLRPKVIETVSVIDTFNKGT